MRILTTLAMLLASFIPSLAATTWPAGTNTPNQTFFGNNNFLGNLQQGGVNVLTNAPSVTNTPTLNGTNTFTGTNIFQKTIITTNIVLSSIYGQDGYPVFSSGLFGACYLYGVVRVGQIYSGGGDNFRMTSGDAISETLSHAAKIIFITPMASFSGTGTFTNGVASYRSNQVASISVSAAGWTNTFGVQAKVAWPITIAPTLTFTDGTAYTPLVGNFFWILGPNEGIAITGGTVGTGVAKPW